MLEKPAISDETIVACVQDAFGLEVERLSFLPLGADMNTAVYRVAAKTHKVYFLKLRSGDFKEISVTLPQFLSTQGIKELIPLCPTQTNQLWTSLGDYKVMLYPFIEGHDAYEMHLTKPQWRQFGRALKTVHTAVLPPSIAAKIPKEIYSPKWRKIVKEFMQRIRHEPFTEPVAFKMAAFLNGKRSDVLTLLARTEQLAQIVQNQPQENVLCHSDIHAWNLLIDTDGMVYIVDWDDPVLAPKERDLMFIGAGLGDIWKTPQEEILFYEGYGSASIDRNILAYYRCERIIQDIAVYCEQIFLSDEGGEDRVEALRHLTSNFLTNGTIDIAMNTNFVRH